MPDVPHETSVKEPWALPSDANSWLKALHERMMDEIAKLNFPNLLSSPHLFNLSGIQARLRSNILGDDHFDDLDERLALLSYMDDIFSSIDYSVARECFVKPKSQVNEIPADTSALLDLHSKLNNGLIALVRSRTVAQLDSLDLDSSVGVLLLALIVWHGHAAQSFLVAALDNIGAAINVVGGRHIVEIASPAMSARRCLELNPITAILWASAGRHQAALQELRAKASSPQAWRKQQYQRINRCVRSAAGFLERVPTLANMLRCKEVWLRCHVNGLIASIAAERVASTPLQLRTLLRIEGYRQPNSASAELPGKSRSGEIAPDEGITAKIRRGELDRHGFVSALTKATSGPRETWVDSLKALDAASFKSPEELTTGSLLVRWLISLSNGKDHKGKKRSDGTIKAIRGMLAARLIAAFPDKGWGEFDEDELTQCYFDVIEMAASEAHEHFVAQRLREFDRFVRSTQIVSLPAVSISGFSTQGYDISANILSPDEYWAAHAWLRQHESAGVLSHSETLRAGAFLTLAFRVGLRRREILGLRTVDIQWLSKQQMNILVDSGHRAFHCIVINKNSYRDLKTRNAKRVVPVYFDDSKDAEMLRDLLQLALGEQRQLLFWDNQEAAKHYTKLADHPAVQHVKKAIVAVTGDRATHPHHLRHSTATLMLYAAIAKDTHAASHPLRPSFSDEAIKEYRRLEPLMNGDLQRTGWCASSLAMLMGHASEKTTIQHYVHGFDFLLFSATDSFFRVGGESRSAGQLLSIDGTTTQMGALKTIKALHGLSETRSLPYKSLREFSGWLSRRYPSVVEIAIAAKKEDMATAAWSLQPLLLEKDLSVVGRPSSVAQVKTAMATLELILEAANGNSSAIVKALSLWVSCKLEGFDWSSMTKEQFLEFKALWTANAATGIDAIQVEATSYQNGRKQRERRRVDPGAAETIGAGDSQTKFWVRLKDVTKNAGGLRSRSQAAVTWTIIVLDKMLREQPLNGLTLSEWLVQKSNAC